MQFPLAGQRFTRHARRARGTAWFLALAVVVWGGILACGFAAMVRYEFTPGDHGARAAQWPEHTALPRDASRPTLVLFAHPHCPCTRATLDELERIIARAPEVCDYHVLFAQPAGTPDDFHHGPLLERAQAISNVTVAVDHAGLEAERFGARTSGDAVLYAADGRLLFHGGITGSRGHAGDNAGQTAVLDLLTGRRESPGAACVFGCPLRADAPASSPLSPVTESSRP